MEQLVGLPCAHCGKSVDSILEGRFCEGCGNPRHTKCRKPPSDLPDLCNVCGGAKANPHAKEAGVSQFTSILKSGPDETREPGPFPVSKVCPSCGRTEFFKIRPNQLIAFMYDRV